MKRLHKFFLVLIIIGVSASNLYADEKITPEQLVREVKNSNPELNAAYAKWMSAREKIPQESALPDPMATYVIMGDDIETRLGPQKHKYAISQKFPLFGKLSLKGEIAKKDALAQEQNYYFIERKLIAGISKVYYELLWVYKAIEITQADSSLLERLEEAAQAKYASGGGTQQDVLKAQVEISKAQERLLNFKQRKTALEAKINALLNRPQGAPVGRPADESLPELNYTLEQLYGAAREHNQRLRTADIMIDRDKSKLSLSKRLYLPDITVGFEYTDIGGGTTAMQDDGRNAWMIPLTVNLPIWENRLAAGVRQSRKDLESSEEEFKNVKNTVFAEVDDLYFRLRTSKDVINLYKTAVVPQASQSLDSADAGYRANEVDFLHLLDSERVWLSANLTYWRAVTDYGIQFAELEQAVGEDLSTGGK